MCIGCVSFGCVKKVLGVCWVLWVCVGCVFVRVVSIKPTCKHLASQVTDQEVRFPVVITQAVRFEGKGRGMQMVQ